MKICVQYHELMSLLLGSRMNKFHNMFPYQFKKLLSKWGHDRAINCSSAEDGLSVGTIAGIAGGGGGGILLVLVIVIIWLVRRKKEQQGFVFKTEKFIFNHCNFSFILQMTTLNSLIKTRGPQTLTVTWVSEILHWLLVRGAHICISTCSPIIE
mgnify:CR=1 FL=1